MNGEYRRLVAHRGHGVEPDRRNASYAGWIDPDDAFGAPAVNPVAWLLWLAGVAAVPLVSRNPMYLSLDLLMAVAVYLALPRRGRAARAWRLFALVGFGLALLSVGFNVLTVHVGDRVFARIPGGVPIAGGPLTWNAFAYGCVSALAVATLLIGATAFNTAVRHGDLLRLMPGSLARLGMAGSVALTMIPQTIASGRDILEAQRARGLRLRGPRDARGIVVPLLATGLERAVGLSEALETRGFGASVTIARSRPSPALLIAAGTALIAALALLGIGRLWPALGILALAGMLALRAAPAGVRRTRLREVHWNVASLAVAGGALLALAGLLAAGALLPASLAWDPFPRLSAPAFEPLVGGALLGLLVPAFVAGAGRGR